MNLFLVISLWHDLPGANHTHTILIGKKKVKKKIITGLSILRHIARV